MGRGGLPGRFAARDPSIQPEKEGVRYRVSTKMPCPAITDATGNTLNLLTNRSILNKAPGTDWTARTKFEVFLV